jgi:ABC-type sulfate/molybdate transport systems ATPase subunit
VGPSGAGKSTVLRLIAGLASPAAGFVECDGQRWFGDRLDVPPQRRAVGFVFQHYALFPHLSVRGNVAFGAGRNDVSALLDRLGIGHLADARPATLSGGERQRVALARALASRPRLLLLDEPLAALDPATRSGVAAELAAVLRDSGLPSLVVTHSYEEAGALAARIVVVEQGLVTQEGSVRDLLEAPATPFVARFTGMNVLARGEHGAVAVAPWQLTLSRETADGATVRTVESSVLLGNRIRVSLGDLVAELDHAAAERLALSPGDRVAVNWPVDAERPLRAL